MISSCNAGVFSHGYGMLTGLAVILALMEVNMLLEKQGQLFTVMQMTCC